MIPLARQFVPREPFSGAAVVAEARAWVGTPFMHQASLRGVGCDCIGLVAGVALSLGIPEAAAWLRDQRFRGYGRLPKPADLLEACRIYLDRLYLSQVGLGDILLFTFVKEPMHFGIVSAEVPRYVIHAYEPRGAVVENSLGGKWERRVVGAYRLRGRA